MVSVQSAIGRESANGQMQSIISIACNSLFCKEQQLKQPKQKSAPACGRKLLSGNEYPAGDAWCALGLSEDFLRQDRWITDIWSVVYPVVSFAVAGRHTTLRVSALLDFYT